jgi:hypothetical protein
MSRLLFLFAVLSTHVAAFDPDLALKLAYLEKSVYCGQERFDRWDVGDSIAFGPEVDTDHLSLIENFDTKCIVGVGRMFEPQGCFVAIHGTTGNWYLDGEFLHKSYDRAGCKDKRCKVFQGFLHGWESVRDQVRGNITAMGCDNQPLYLVGHSLGAAMLHFAMLEMLHDSLDVRVAYALESPRVGNDVWSDVVQDAVQGRDIWRVVHHKDIVPHVPPRDLPFGLQYIHALREIFFPNHTGADYVECGIEDPKCSDQYFWWEGQPSEHCWFADLDPCHCTNHTNTAPGHSSVIV